MEAHNFLELFCFLKKQQGTEFTSCINKIKTTVFELNHRMSSGHCQVIESYVRLVAAAKLYPLIFGCQHVYYFISCILLDSLKSQIRLVRFMKLNELESLTFRNYFVWKLLLAQLTLEP